MSLIPDSPLNDLVSERYVLGSILRDNRCMDDATSLMPEDFSHPLHQDVFHEMRKLSAGRYSIDFASVADMLRSAGKLKTDDEPFLGELKNDDFTTAKIKYHVRTVKRYALRRKGRQAAFDILRETDNPSDPDNYLDMIEEIAFSVREKGVETETQTLQHYMQRTWNEVSAMEQSGDSGLSTGLIELDKYMTLRPGQLTVIAARPGGGKSISGLQFGMNVASQGNAVVFYSLEMSGEELAARAISSFASIDANFVTRKRAGKDEEHAQLSDAVAKMYKLPVHINDRPWNSIHGIIADARRAKRRHDVKMVVVDYLQLVTSIRAKGQLRYEQLGEITQSLKQLAKELLVPVILLAQLNRDSEKNGADKEPQLWHIKESGSAEQDADVVLLLWPTPQVSGLEDRVNIKIAKNRHGVSGKVVRVRHAKQYMRFDNDGEC